MYTYIPSLLGLPCIPPSHPYKVITEHWAEFPVLYSSFLIAIYFTHGRRWHPTPVLLPGKSHGQGSLVGCSPWHWEELDMTERLHFHFSLSCIGEGNGTPLQYSCLENSRDGGAWWAAIYGVAQSRTRLNRFSSSSSSSSSVYISILIS